MVVENNRTLAYGEEWQPTVGSDNEHKFTTYQRDGESGLDYAGARYYGSRCGCFASADQGPMTLYAPATLNRYAYAVADPINYTDRTGNFIAVKTPRPQPPTIGLSYSYGQQAPQNDDFNPEENPYDDELGVLERLIGIGVTSRAQQNALVRGYKRTREILEGNGDCLTFFGGISALRAFETVKFQYVPFESIDPITGDHPSAWTPDGTDRIYLLPFGAFERPLMPTRNGLRNFVDDSSLRNQQDFRAMILLHELGHFVGKFGPDRGFPGATQINETNSANVIENCFRE